MTMEKLEEFLKYEPEILAAIKKFAAKYDIKQRRPFVRREIGQNYFLCVWTDGDEFSVFVEQCVAADAGAEFKFLFSASVDDNENDRAAMLYQRLLRGCDKVGLTPKEN